jgi:hypothetical protein
MPPKHQLKSIAKKSIKNDNDDQEEKDEATLLEELYQKEFGDNYEEEEVKPKEDPNIKKWKN